jgi:hypothetical protein
MSELTGRGITASRTVGKPRGAVLHKDGDFVVLKMSNTVSELSILLRLFISLRPERTAAPVIYKEF